MAGLYFEQFEVDRVFKHEITRSVTASDNMLFCNMTLNPQPLHIDFNFAKDTEFGQPLVNSLFTLGLVIGISVYDTTLGTTIANLGMENTQFPNPVFHGDTIRVETRVVSLRESKSRPMAGIVVFEHKGINQRGEVVCLCTRSAFMRKKPT
jgi:acyl dehydratase